MIRSFISFPIADLQQTKLQVLNWANRFNICCLLDNQQYHLSPHSFEVLIAAGATQTVKASAGNAFDQLLALHNESRDWLFGHMGYDLKNELETDLHSHHPDGIGFPDLFFFVPEVILQLSETEISIGVSGHGHAGIWQQIQSMPDSDPAAPHQITSIHSRIDREEYIRIIRQIQQHILRGDCYELNFCQEFFATGCTIDPVAVYDRLCQTSPNPFAAFYKTGDHYLLCASPERYLKKTGNTILSQPIKGTWQRDTENREEDERNRNRLLHSAKDRSENVMIVDLVRNDLSKICAEGKVGVDELFGIYSFPQVHQMISTISGQLRPDIHFMDAIKATFPMGSMTGAPKKRVMELIEQYEKTRRGVFSGSVGYITPEGDFDFNVIIRSILYNTSSRYLSFQAGSGITFYSDPGQEYEECLLKAAAIKKVLGTPSP